MMGIDVMDKPILSVTNAKLEGQVNESSIISFVVMPTLLHLLNTHFTTSPTHASPTPLQFTNMETFKSGLRTWLNSDPVTWKGSDFLEGSGYFLPEVDGARYGGYFELVQPTKTKPIIDEKSLHLIKEIPPLHLIKQGIDFFNTNQTDKSFMYIVRFGYVAKEVLNLLAKLHDAMDFAVNLLEMLKWLNEDPGGSDGTFTKRLRQRLLGQDDLMQYKFSSPYGILTSARSALFFRGEAWIDDSATDAIMEPFQKKYGHRGTYFFLPTQALNTWIQFNRVKPTGHLPFPLNSYQSTVLTMADEARKALEAKQNKDVKVFAVTDLQGHWGALCVDFMKEEILFGHSLDRGMQPDRPPPAVQVLGKWLDCCGVSVNGWYRGRLDVAQQGPGSGSCGINALNAIERYLDPRVEFWAGKRSRYHRVRLLRLLTGPAEVCST